MCFICFKCFHITVCSQGRFAQQVHDAAVMRDKIVGYYTELFNHPPPPSPAPAPPTPPVASVCDIDRGVTWNSSRVYLFLKPCNSSDLHQQWSGDTFKAALPEERGKAIVEGGGVAVALGGRIDDALTGDALNGALSGSPSAITNGANGYCVDTAEHDPMDVVPCGAPGTKARSTLH